LSTVALRTKEDLSVMRIYLRRRTMTSGRGWKSWFKRRSISHELAQQALKTGVTYASVSLGHLGFLPGGKHLVAYDSDPPPTMLPTCVELLGDRAVLEAFVSAYADELADAVVVRFDGVAVSMSSDAS
jgi:hypothetical protein